jgi:hypothetical protein
MKRLLGICIVCFVLTACAPTVSESEASTLAREVAHLLEQQTKVGSLSSASWPPSVAVLKPQAVYLRAEGLYIKTSSFFTEERGVFVLNPKSAFSPTHGTDPSYKLVTERVFVYRSAG